MKRRRRRIQDNLSYLTLRMYLQKKNKNEKTFIKTTKQTKNQLHQQRNDSL